MSQIPDVSAIQSFFETVYPGLTEGYLVISSPDPYKLKADGTHPFASDWVNVHDHHPPEIAQAIARFSATRNIYFGVAIQHPDCEPAYWKRSKNMTAYVVPGLWADVDLAYGKHAASTLPTTDTEAFDFLQTCPQPPSLVCHSGGGLYGYWLFHRPYLLTSPMALAAMATLVKRFAHTVVTAGNTYGWTLDAVNDLARVLRPAGTINHKYGTCVKVIHEAVARYDPATDFTWLHELPVQPPRATGSMAPLTGQPDIVAVAEFYGAVLTQKSQAELSGAHPSHGSSTGGNFNVNPEKGVWHCWRHGTGDDVLTLIAVCEGLIACEDVYPGCLRGALFTRVVDIANAQLGAQIPDRRAAMLAVQTPVFAYTDPLRYAKVATLTYQWSA
jgi:hypothetical protein